MSFAQHEESESKRHLSFQVEGKALQQCHKMQMLNEKIINGNGNELASYQGLFQQQLIAHNHLPFFGKYFQILQLATFLPKFLNILPFFARFLRVHNTLEKSGKFCFSFFLEKSGNVCLEKSGKCLCPKVKNFNFKSEVVYSMFF